MNNKGQAFTLYKMLISVIFVFLLLMIIISAINYFDGLRREISSKRVFEAVKQAVKQPNGDIFKVGEVYIKKGSTISSVSFSDETGISDDCFSFNAASSGSFEFDSRHISAKADYTGDVYIKCVINNSDCSSECQVCCTFSIGKEPS